MRTLYWIMSILGLVLFIAPFVFGFSGNVAAMWACIILGLVVAISAGCKAVVQDQARWEVVLVLGAGVLAVVSPFVLGFSSNLVGTWTSIVLGLGMAVLAGKDLYEHRTVR